MLKRHPLAFVAVAFLLGSAAGHFGRPIALAMLHDGRLPMLTTGSIQVKDYRGGSRPCPIQPGGGVLPGTPVEVEDVGSGTYRVTVPPFYVFGLSLPIQALSPGEYSKWTAEYAACGP